MSKIDEQLMWVLLNIYNRKMVRMEEQEVEGSLFNKQSYFLVLFLNLSWFSHTESINEEVS